MAIGNYYWFLSVVMMMVALVSSQDYIEEDYPLLNESPSPQMQVRRPNKQLYELMEQFVDKFHDLCKQVKVVKLETIMAVMDTCVRSILLQTPWIPEEIFPMEFDRIAGKCLEHDSNICNRRAKKKMRKCFTKYGMITFKKAQLVFQQHRPEAFAVAQQIGQQCFGIGRMAMEQAQEAAAVAMASLIQQHQQQQQQQIMTPIAVAIAQ